MVLRIADLLAEKGMRKADLARRAGLTQSNLNSAINNGNPTIETLERIAKALEVEVHELLTDRLPSKQEAVFFMNGEAYALVKAPNPVNLAKYDDIKALSVAVEAFVKRSVIGRQNASFSAFSDAGELFTLFYLYDLGGEAERFLLSITSGVGEAYTNSFLLVEYQKNTKDGDMAWDEKAIERELLSEIKGIGRGAGVNKTCKKV